MKKIFILIIILIITGCNNYNDIKNLAIINEIAIDYDKEFKVYTKVLSSNQENDNKIYEEKCNTLNECFNNINNKLSKKLYLTHLDLLILTTSLKQNQYQEIINYFMKEQSSRNNFNVITVDKINKNILDINSKDIINMIDLSTVVKSVKFEDIIKDILNFNTSYIPYIDTSNNELLGNYQIYEEEILLSKEESIALNFITNSINKISLLIDKNIYNLEDCNTNIYPKNNYINIKITCNYKGEKDETIINNYIEKIIKDFINNSNQNYLNYIKEKYNIKDKLKINIKVNISKYNTGDIFE